MGIYDKEGGKFMAYNKTAQKKYDLQTGYARQNEFNKKNIKQIMLKFNKEKDADIIEYLQIVPNVTDYVRNLIREDIRIK